MLEEPLDPYLKWLGIRDPVRPPHHYALLGLRALEDDSEVIANAADRQMLHVKSFQSGPHATLSQQLLNELSAARVCLLNPQRKAEYDRQLLAAGVLSATSPASPASAGPTIADPISARVESDHDRPRLVLDAPSPPRRQRSAKRLALLTGMFLLISIAASAWWSNVLPLPTANRRHSTTQANPSAPNHRPSRPADASSAGPNSSDVPSPDKPTVPAAPQPTSPHAPAAAAPKTDQTPGTSLPAPTNVASSGSSGLTVKIAPEGTKRLIALVETALAQRQPEQAGILLKLVSGGTKTSELQSETDRLVWAQRELSTFWKTLRSAAAAQVGKPPLDVAGEPVTIVDWQTNTLSVRRGSGETQRMPISDIPRDLAQALVRCADKPEFAERQRATIAFLTFDAQRDRAAAQQALDELDELGNDVSEIARMCSLVERPAAERRPAGAPQPIPPAQTIAAAQRDVDALVAERRASAAESPRDAALFLVGRAKTDLIDPSARFALFDRAIELAASAGEWSLVESLVDQASGYFVIDRDVRLATALSAWVDAIREPAAALLALRAADALVEKTVAGDRFDLAARLVVVRVAAAKLAQDPAVLQAARTAAEELRRQQSRFRQLAPQFEQLKLDPEDAEASLAVGRFRCFDQRRWDEGLPLLAHGPGDESLATLARRDLELPPTPDEQLALADGWWEASSRESGLARAAVRSRAAHWYQSALPELTGLARVRAESRLSVPGDAPRTPAARPTGPEEIVFPISEDVALSLRRVDAGSFLRGDTTPPTEVTLSQPFYLAITEATQAQWLAAMHENPSQLVGGNRLDCPVERVSWEMAQRFVARLTALAESASGTAGRLRFRLPTEAEWEIACRAGSSGRYAFGNDPAGLADFAWYSPDNAGGRTHPVAQKRPNAWGFFDMHGNVWEWCQDWFGPLPTTASADPTGPPLGENRIVRGGSFLCVADECRSASRAGALPARADVQIGVRVAADLLAAPR